MVNQNIIVYATPSKVPVSWKCLSKLGWDAAIHITLWYSSLSPAKGYNQTTLHRHILYNYKYVYSLWLTCKVKFIEYQTTGRALGFLLCGMSSKLCSHLEARVFLIGKASLLKRILPLRHAVANFLGGVGCCFWGVFWWRIIYCMNKKLFGFNITAGSVHRPSALGPLTFLLPLCTCFFFVQRPCTWPFSMFHLVWPYPFPWQELMAKHSYSRMIIYLSLNSNMHSSQ